MNATNLLAAAWQSDQADPAVELLVRCLRA
jgi:hypothetical protein